jgi:hypothetical protein
MSEHISLADARSKVPSSINISGTILRGSPSEMVLSMVACDTAVSVTEALKAITESYRRTKKIDIELPWELEEELLATLFISSLLEIGICKPAYLA